MKLVENWKEILTNAHSMWSVYLGLFWLIFPEVIFGVWGIDTNPSLWWWLAVVTLAYGGFGRVVKQWWSK